MELVTGATLGRAGFVSAIAIISSDLDLPVEDWLLMALTVSR